MKIGGKYDPDDVYLRHWHRLVPDTAGAKNALEKTLSDLAGRTLDQATKLYAELKAENVISPILDSILSLIKKRATRVGK
jgi:hypothetical protein